MMQDLHTQGTFLPMGKCGRPLQSFGGTLKDRPSVWGQLFRSFRQSSSKQQDDLDRAGSNLPPALDHASSKQPDSPHKQPPLL